MIRQAFCILISCCLFAQSGVRLAWGLYYHYNKAVFLQNCENKNKPAACCEGKCQLRKVIATDNSRNPEAPAIPSGLRDAKDLQVFWEAPEKIIFQEPSPTGSAPFPDFQFTLPEPPSAGLFRPPAIA